MDEENLEVFGIIPSKNQGRLNESNLFTGYSNDSAKIKSDDHRSTTTGWNEDLEPAINGTGLTEIIAQPALREH